jgi:NADP-dependent 3-hydroxy acid dehydrogenase YdfG
MVKETVEKLGGLDIIIANAGWTRFSDFKDLHALSHDDWNKVRLFTKRSSSLVILARSICT